MDPIMIKTVLGEELLGLVTEFDGFVNIKNPAILAGGEKGLTLFPYAEYTEADETGLNIQRDHIIWMVDVKPDMAKAWREWQLKVVQDTVWEAPENMDELMKEDPNQAPEPQN